MQGRNYRISSGQPLTRKEFAPSAPNTKIARFSTGKKSETHDVKFLVVAKNKVQIRDNALEATRVAINKKLAKIGEEAYFLSVRVYPHVILRENKMIATAGADRLQEGMRRSFGKPIRLAARVDDGDVLFELEISLANISLARESLETAVGKLPVRVQIIQVPVKLAQAG